jgi:hypothetical protein
MLALTAAPYVAKAPFKRIPWLPCTPGLAAGAANAEPFSHDKREVVAREVREWTMESPYWTSIRRPAIVNRIDRVPA